MRTSIIASCGLAIGLANAVALGGVDGTVDGADGYGPALSVQTTNTGFGDNFSEWNAAYGKNDGSKLRLGFTGNLEANFNKFEVFIDSRSGGQTAYSASGTFDGTNAMNGLRFDNGFEPDYHLVLRRGSSKFDLSIIRLSDGFVSDHINVFGGTDFGSGTTPVGPANANGIDIAYNGSNAAGVIGGNGPANPAAALAVTTGVELGISLSDLGFDGGNICVWAFQNNQNHNYASNQFLPGLVNPQGNLGGDGSGGFNGTFALDMNNFYPGAAEGWFTVVPAPGAMSLLGLGGLLAARRRR